LTLTTVFLVGIVIIATVLAARLWFVRRHKSQKLAIFKNEVSWFYKSIKPVMILAVMAFLYGLVNYLYVLQSGSTFAPNYLNTLFTIFLGIYSAFEMYCCCFVSTTRAKPFSVFINIASLGLIGLVSFVLCNNFFRANQYPAPADCASIDLPFEGEWVAIGAGATKLTNHHDRIPSQKYAIDIARIGDNGKLFIGEGKTSAESNTFGARIISPVHGVVVFAVDGLEDDKSKKQLAGNHVINQFGDEEYVALAHFQKGSVQVQIGDTLRVGDEIARAGNSGNSDFPHLHIHVQNTPVYDIKNTLAKPFRFREINRKRYFFSTTERHAFLLSNDRVKK